MKRSALRFARVDPRVRGEAAVHDWGETVPEGRSPRARGSLVLNMGHPAISGSIPACAGKPPGEFDSRYPLQVDPRVRGEALFNLPSAIGI